MAPTPRKKKGKNYTLSELNRMLDLVEQMLPFGSEQWENLAACYNAHIPSGHAERDGDSLSRKFKKLYKVPKPSGNGTCPPHIERSKRLKRMIESSIAVATLHSDDDAEDNSEDELDTADASGSDDAMVDHAAEEGQPLRSPEETLNRTPLTPIDTSSFPTPSTHDSPPSTNNPQSSPNEMPLAPDNMPPSPTNSPPITNSASPMPQAVHQAASVAAPVLVATARAGMAPSELAALSKRLAQSQLKRNASSAGILSQTAQRRRRIDAAIDKASSKMSMDNSSEFSSPVVVMMFMMEERQAASDAEYQRRKDEREREQAEREEKRAAERDVRDQQSQQLMMMLMTKLMGDRNNN